VVLIGTKIGDLEWPWNFEWRSDPHFALFHRIR